MWTVGLALSGSPAGWTQAEFEAASPAEKATVRSRVHAEFASTGAHYVIDTLADLPPVLHEIQQRLARGERP